MEKKFHFTHPFLESFKETIDVISDRLNVLNTLEKGFATDMGIYNCSYKMRYLTPSDVAEYISNVHKGISSGLISANPHDIEMFTAESARRFLESHECEPFSDPGLMGNNFIDTKNTTLQDMLVIHSNSVFNHVARTPYEQKENYEDMKKGDLKLINDIHYVANMKKIVDKMPDMIENMEGGEIYKAQPVIGKAFRAAIEEFVMFASTLNAITVSSMVDYAVPSATFTTNYESTGEDDDMLQETVDLTKNTPIYFVFAEGKTRVISNAIKKATKSPYSHISIAFDEKLNPMYSFGGKIENDTYNNDKNGVRKEDISGNYYANIDVAVYAGYLPNESVGKMKKICDDFVKNADKTNFDYGILLKKLVKKDGEMPKDHYRQVCSTFVNYLLNQVDVNLTDKKMPSPAEIKNVADTKATQFIKVYTGPAAKYNDKIDSIVKRVTSAAEKGNTKAINEYFTECCFLKTNTMSIEKRLPFNCNMRNVVLNDTHEYFKDTRDAVRFILNDSRSPIHDLLVKFATKRGDYGTAEMVRQAFLTHPHSFHGFDPKTPEQNYEERRGFYSDPCWLDKIVYGSQELDSNYRTDNPGNHHEHPLSYDIKTIYKMFSCHHNDNEHLANNIVKVANVMVGLIEGYTHDEYAIFRDNLRDVLAVFGEILTKDILTLYHNNNNVLICSDDMNDTMIPGYMYCEAFVMEADGDNNQQQNKEVTKNPTVKNTSQTFKDTKWQTVKMKIAELIRKFGEYIRNTISQIFPKFNQNHKAEVNWINNHKELNQKIGQALSTGQFKIQVNNYPNFDIPIGEAVPNLKKSIENLTTDLNDENKRKQILTDAGGTKESLKAITDRLLFPEVAAKNPQTDSDMMKMTKFYILYKNPDGPQQSGENVNIGIDQWNQILGNLVGKSGNDGAFKAIEMFTSEVTQAMTKLNETCKKLADKEIADAKKAANDAKANGDNPQTQANDNTNGAQKLFEAVQKISKNCYLAATSALIKDFYGRSYNMYRDIVAEYQRTTVDENTKPQEQQQKTEEKKTETNTQQTQQQPQTQPQTQQTQQQMAEIPAAPAAQAANTTATPPANNSAQMPEV